MKRAYGRMKEPRIPSDTPSNKSTTVTSPNYKILVQALITILGTSMIYSGRNLFRDTPFTHRRMIASMAADDPTVPSIAWLLAYPLSGASYTALVITEATETTTASNYGTVLMTKGYVLNKMKFPSIPLYEQSQNGPYYFGDEFDAPECEVGKPCYILTRNHGGGYCFTDCPKYYQIGPNDFFKNCVYGSRFQNGKEVIVKYNFDLVKKAVHLIRNPFDNIASRHKHLVDVSVTKNNTAFTDTYPPTNLGFQTFCADEDAKRWDAANFTYLKSFGLADVAKDIPCYSELFRWIQWHNNVFFIRKTHLKDIPTHMLHFEDLVENPYSTLVDLLDFLGLTKIKQPEAYWPGEYWTYYTDLQKAKVLEFVQALASVELWSQIKRYFEEMDLID